MASIYQAIANDGVRVEPRIVDSVTAPGRPGERDADEPEGTRVISEATADAMAYMLEAVVGPGRHRAARARSRASASPARPAPRSGPTPSAAATTAAATSPPSSASPRPTTRSTSSPSTWSGPPAPPRAARSPRPVFADILRYALTADGVVPSGTPRPDFELTPPPDRSPRGTAAGRCAPGRRAQLRGSGGSPPVDWSPVTPTDAGSAPRPAGGRPQSRAPCRWPSSPISSAPRSAPGVGRRSGRHRRHARLGRGAPR